MTGLPKKFYVVVDSRGDYVKTYRMKHYALKKCERFVWDRETHTSSIKPNGNKVLVTEVSFVPLEESE